MKTTTHSRQTCPRVSSNIYHQTFKLEISKDDLMKVYNPDFWPSGINIRRYFPPKGGDKRTDSTQSNGETGANSSQNETIKRNFSLAVTTVSILVLTIMLLCKPGVV